MLVSQTSCLKSFSVFNSQPVKHISLVNSNGVVAS